MIPKTNKIILAGCVILKGDTILLLHRIKSDWYELPGGKIEGNESPEKAAIRELQEELSCQVEIIKKIDTKDFVENDYIMEYHWFLAKISANNKPAVGEPDKYDHFSWLPLDNLQKYHLSPNMQNFHKFILKKIY